MNEKMLFVSFAQRKPLAQQKLCLHNGRGEELRLGANIDVNRSERGLIFQGNARSHRRCLHASVVKRHIQTVEDRHSGPQFYICHNIIAAGYDSNPGRQNYPIKYANRPLPATIIAKARSQYLSESQSLKIICRYDNAKPLAAIFGQFLPKRSSLKPIESPRRTGGVFSPPRKANSYHIEYHNNCEQPIAKPLQWFFGIFLVFFSIHPHDERKKEIANQQDEVRNGRLPVHLSSQWRITSC